MSPEAYAAATAMSLSLKRVAMASGSPPTIIVFPTAAPFCFQLERPGRKFITFTSYYLPSFCWHYQKEQMLEGGQEAKVGRG